MNSNDIFSRLMAGESAEAIAAEFTDALNAAQTQYDEKTSAAKVKLEMTRDADNIAALLKDFANKYYDFDLDGITGEQLIAVFDASADTAKLLSKMFEDEASFDRLFSPFKPAVSKTNLKPDELDHIFNILSSKLKND